MSYAGWIDLIVYVESLRVSKRLCVCVCACRQVCMYTFLCAHVHTHTHWACWEFDRSIHLYRNHSFCLFPFICCLLVCSLCCSYASCFIYTSRYWHHYKGKPKWSSFEGSGSGRDGQALSSSNLDTHLHWWLSWKRHKKRRLWCLHQAPRQASIICVSTWWDTVLKLQSWSPSTAKCHRNHHFMGREAQESSLPHRLIISPASPHVWWAWHNAKEAHREHQHPRSNYLCSSSVDTSTHRHSGKRNGRSACKRRKGKRATPIASVIQRSQNSYP